VLQPVSRTPTREWVAVRLAQDSDHEAPFAGLNAARPLGHDEDDAVRPMRRSQHDLDQRSGHWEESNMQKCIPGICDTNYRTDTIHTRLVFHEKRKPQGDQFCFGFHLLINHSLCLEIELSHVISHVQSQPLLVMTSLVEWYSHV
jgi:hypothetical protein